MNAGFGMPVIRSIAGWEGKSALRYLQNLSAFKLGISVKMGF
jgi:hypothetical protein